MTNVMVPSKRWGSAAEAFKEELEQEDTEQLQQKLLCVECCRENNTEPSDRIILFQGTSYCVEHLQNMV